MNFPSPVYSLHLHVEPIRVDLQNINDTAKELLLNSSIDEGVRLLGISISNFGEKSNLSKSKSGQLSLFVEGSKF